MVKCISNTIVKNGMPFIGKVLEQAAPLMDKMIITLSEKSNDGTKDEILKILAKYPEKLILLYENVSSPADLTAERNKQLQYSDSEWVLTLDDDDYWETEQLKKCIDNLPEYPDILACAVNPIQLLDKENCNSKWEGKKWFSKFLRKTPDLHFVYPWPRDVPKNGEILHWKFSKKVLHLPYRFYHLSEIKDYSFRKKESWAERFNRDKIVPGKLLNPVNFL